MRRLILLIILFMTLSSAIYSESNTNNITTDNIITNEFKEYSFYNTLQLYKLPIVLSILFVFILLILIILIVSIRNKSLKKIQTACDEKDKALVIAQKASLSKGNFLSRMSHEIRTPLNAIIGYNILAHNELSLPDNEANWRQTEMKILDCLSKSEIASKHLLSIINDVLDMASIESGKIKISNDRFDFRGLIVSLTTIFYSQAKFKDIDFDVRFTTPVSDWYQGDQMRTNQILTNLISNAIKFTPEKGSVKLEITKVSETESTNTILFKISDTGIGMSSEYLSHIWNPYEQADASIASRFGGTGLGLSISKNLIDLMNGTISVESKLGQGTTFTVTLTFNNSHQPEAIESIDFSKIHALVIDDDSNTCDYIRLLFNRCGVRCTTVTSGEDAIETYNNEQNNGDPFTLCLVDWKMPKMNGIMTIKEIKKITKKEIPFIVISAYDFTEISNLSDSLGTNLFISKPIFQSALFDLLVNICGKKENKHITSESKFKFNNSKILLTEDNAMNLEISSRLLISAGMDVVSAVNGQEAVEKFLHAPVGTFKAILMDIQMPVMDGYTATQIIRTSSHPEAKTIPIIAMTADAFSENIAQSLNVGMNDHISKPIDIQNLFSTIKRYVKD